MDVDRHLHQLSGDEWRELEQIISSFERTWDMRSASLIPTLLPVDQPMRDAVATELILICLLYTSPSPRDKRQSRMPSSA